MILFEAIKRHKWVAASREPQTDERNNAITFEEIDTQHLVQPHDETLGITVDVANYEVSKFSETLEHS